MKNFNKLSFLTAIVVLLLFSCSKDNEPANKTIIGKWYAEAYGFADAKTFYFGSDGKGYLATKDNAGICNPTILNFSFTYTADSVTCIYDAAQPAVHCPGAIDTNPISPGTITQTYSISGNTLILGSGPDESVFTNQITTATVVDNLHFSFKTPDWERVINCELLAFDPTPVNDSTAYAYATSQSTNATFCFSYPKDSSDIVKAKIFKNHKIKGIYENNEPFQFSLKLNLDANSIGDINKRLGSQEGFSPAEYCQVTEVNYLASDANYAVFRVKCKYKMQMYLYNDPTTIKPVAGDFTFKVKTTKN